MRAANIEAADISIFHGDVHYIEEETLMAHVGHVRTIFLKVARELSLDGLYEHVLFDMDYIVMKKCIDYLLQSENLSKKSGKCPITEEETEVYYLES